MNPLIVSLLVSLFELLGKTIPPILESMRRTRELSDGEWSALKTRMDAAMQAPHWKPEGT